MVVVDNILKDLKAQLFDLNILIGKTSQTDIMQQLVQHIQQLLEVNVVSLAMYNKWNKDHQFDILISSDEEDIKDRALKYISNYHQYPTVHYTENQNKRNYVTKIICNHHYYGMLFIASDQGHIAQQLLETISELVSLLIKRDYNYRNSAYLRKRKQYFFELTTTLHAVNETTEILRYAYNAFQRLYPYFHFSLMMSKEYECEDIPVELIEYAGDMAQSPGTIAFINNKVKMFKQEDKDEMQLYTPLAGKQGVYGVVKIMMPQIVDESELELDLIIQLSNMIGMAIERTTLFQSSNKQVSDLQIINSASQALNLKLKRTDIIETVKKYITKTSEANEFAIVLMTEETQKNQMSNAYEILENSTAYFTSERGRKLIDYLYHHVTEFGEAILSGNFQTKYQESPYHSIMAIPMWSANTIFGYIVTAHPMPYYFTFDRFKFIQSFIQHASLAFKNSMLQEQLEHMATTDYLTQLYSRSYLDEQIITHMNQGDNGVFVLFDIDDFKQVNDTFGHHIGDEVLQDVAKIICEQMKSTSGTAARWGGEEFALYFPQLSMEEVLYHVDQMRQRILNETNPQVTVSCGIAIWQRGEASSTMNHLFINADKALYQAKSSGKNRIVQN